MKIPYDLEEHPLQIRTDSVLGSDEEVRVNFYTSGEDYTTTIGLRFSSPPQYFIQYCTSGFTNLPTTLPEEQEKIWTITKGLAAITINCNEVEVLNLLYTDYGGCVGKMEMDVEQMKFTTSDNDASDAYREAPGGRGRCIFATQLIETKCLL